MSANQITSLDAAMTLLLHVVAHRRGASEFWRYMSRMFYLGISLVLLLSVQVFSVPCHAQSPSAPGQSRTIAPTGIYATPSPVPISLHLGTNGMYEVKSDRGIQKGTWTWDTKRREFDLTPTSGKFRFEIRRLRLGRDDPTTLQWIPTSSLIGGGGAIDYLRLKRQ